MLNFKHQRLKIIEGIYSEGPQTRAQNTGSQLSLKDLNINWRKNCQKPKTIPSEVTNGLICFNQCFVFAAFEQHSEKYPYRITTESSNGKSEVFTATSYSQMWG